MKHIGLFEGVGGFSLAASWMNWDTIAWCEIDSFCQKVLNYHFPNSNKHGDIKTTDFSIYRGSCDIVTGGFPCQPFSAAGKRKGTKDDRYLWKEMLRAVREIQPSYVVGENVRGLTNWNGGLVFDEVQADLESEGYEVLPFLLPACAINAPHRRDRIWFVAHAKHDGCNGTKNRQSDRKGNDSNQTGTPTIIQSSGRSSETTGKIITHPRHIGQEKPEQQAVGGEQLPESGDVANAGNKRLQGGQDFGSTGRIRENGNKLTSRFLQPDWNQFPTQSPVRSRDDGIPGGLAGITVSKHRNESIKAYGNAIVPQVAFQIFKAIEQFENLKTV